MKSQWLKGGLQNLQQAHTDKGPHRLDIYGSPGHQLSGLRFIEIGEAQSLQVVVEVISEVISHTLGNYLGKIPVAVPGNTPGGCWNRE